MRSFPARSVATACLIVFAFNAPLVAGCSPTRGQWSCPALTQN